MAEDAPRRAVRRPRTGVVALESAFDSIGASAPEPQPRPLVVLPPMRISGMAMPNGVYLSNGYARSGSDAGLLASMIGLAIGYGVSSMIMTVVAWAASPLANVPLLAVRGGATLPGEVPGEVYWLLSMQTLHFLIFFGLLRATPLAGYHGAEHMTVQAIETGHELTEENVRRMSRVHARCGTNILAGLLPALIVLSTQRYWPIYVSAPIALGLGMLFRHQIGSAIQYLFTTKPPTRKQLLAGIESGRALLEMSRQTHGVSRSRLQVMWNRGVVQMVLLLAVLVLIQVVVLPQVEAYYYRWLEVGL